MTTRLEFLIAALDVAATHSQTTDLEYSIQLTKSEARYLARVLRAGQALRRNGTEVLHLLTDAELYTTGAYGEFHGACGDYDTAVGGGGDE